MSEFVLWVILAAIGFGLMWARLKAHTKLDPWLERVAAVFFLAAGTISAPGWPSDTVGWVAGGLNSIGAQVGGADQLGTAAALIAALTGSIWWFLGLLPESLFSTKIPDWLTVGGLLLPALAGGIPGVLGETIRALQQFLSDLAVGMTLGLLA